MSIDRPRLPRRPALPSRGPSVVLPVPEIEGRTDETDQFGLALSVFGELPTLSRRYIARAFDHVGADKTITPTHQGLGTIPEMVLFGGLLVEGFVPNQPYGKAFIFQSQFLGGRMPGGSVADFLVLNQNRRIAVMVHSFFHSAQSPFGGAAKQAEEALLYQRIVGSGQADVVVLVNHPADNTPLETGPDALVRRDVMRAING